MEQYKNLCEKAAERWNVASEVHPEDFIFQFVMDAFDSPNGGVDYYFDDGARSARKLKALIENACGLNVNEVSLFEFASGYGCVTRHLGQVMPQTKLVCCDIHQEAVDFTRNVIGAEAILSTHQPQDLAVHEHFDVAFALSFFSHMPKSSFSPWFAKLTEFLKPGGYLLFTTHGVVSREKHLGNIEFDSSGFFFKAFSEQKDLSTSEYGTAAVLPKFVFEASYDIPNVDITSFHGGYWWQHQDLYICRKRPV